MNRRYRPSFRSFFGSLVFDSSPLLVVAAVYYFKGFHQGLLLGIVSAGMVLYSVFLVVQSCVVFLGRLEMSPVGIRSFTAFGPMPFIKWVDINYAMLRERQNPVSRTDRLLILQTPRAKMNFPVSILSREEEQEVIDEVKRRIHLVVTEDRPAV